MARSLAGFNVYAYDEPIIDVQLELSFDQALEFVRKNPDASTQDYGNYFRRKIATNCVLGPRGSGMTIADTNGTCYSLAAYVQMLRAHDRA